VNRSKDSEPINPMDFFIPQRETTPEEIAAKFEFGLRRMDALYRVNNPQEG
jgi:hypothetical protein